MATEVSGSKDKDNDDKDSDRYLVSWSVLVVMSCLTSMCCRNQMTAPWATGAETEAAAAAAAASTSRGQWGYTAVSDLILMTSY